MANIFSEGIFSIFVVVLFAGVLSFFNPRILSIFPTKLGFAGKYTEDNIRKSSLYSLFISIGLISVLLIIGIASIISPRIIKWLYLCFSIVIIRDGMQMTGFAKIIPVFPIVSDNKNKFKDALLIGILGGFLSFPIIMYVFKKAIGFMVNLKLIGVMLFIGYAIGQSVLLLLLELLFSFAQSTSLDPSAKDAKNPKKYIKTLPGIIFIFVGFIMLYLGFKYDLYH